MSLFGGGGVSNKAQYVHFVRVSDSQWGICWPIVYGRARRPTHLIWIGDQHSIKQPGPGKGLTGSSASGSFYKYYATLIQAFCLGPITGFGRSFHTGQNGLVVHRASVVANFWNQFKGALGQAPWSYMTSHHPGKAFGYTGVAYIAKNDFELGTSPTLPQGSFEIFGFLPYSSAIKDADASAVIQDMIANPIHGMVPNAAWIDSAVSFAELTKYIAANNFFISPTFEQQKPGREHLQQIFEMIYADAVWSEGQLRAVPYPTDPVTGNGITWNPNITPITNFSDDDFRLESDTDNELIVKVKDPLLRNNVVRVEFLNVLNQYNIEPFEVMDEADIITNGRSIASSRQYHGIATAGMAGTIGRMYLQRSLAVSRTFEYKVAPTKAALLDPMDVVSLTEPFFGLDALPVRIVSIDEAGDADGNGRSDLEMSLVCEDLAPSTAFIVPPVSGPACDYSGFITADIYYYRGTFVVFMSGPFFYGPGHAVFISIMNSIISLGGSPIAVSLTGPAGTGWYAAEGFNAYTTAFGPWPDPILGTIDNSGVVTCPAPPSIPPDSQPPGGGPGNDPESDPTPVNVPFFVEPRALATLPHTLWIALSGQPNPDVFWGGANVYMSDDGGSTYRQIGACQNPATMGVLALPLPAHADPDTVNTLDVDLTESAGVLSSISTAQADKAYNLAWVDGEYIAFANVGPGLVDPLNPNEFALTYLRRGLYGSSPSAHLAGAPFFFLNSITFLDPGVTAVSYPSNDVGTFLRFKFVSFNNQGGAPEDLSTVGDYLYLPLGP